jgi:hypothetical protein
VPFGDLEGFCRAPRIRDLPMDAANVESPAGKANSLFLGKQQVGDSGSIFEGPEVPSFCMLQASEAPKFSMSWCS